MLEGNTMFLIDSIGEHKGFDWLMKTCLVLRRADIRPNTYMQIKCARSKELFKEREKQDEVIFSFV
jgi:hypothetical protein